MASGRQVGYTVAMRMMRGAVVAVLLLSGTAQAATRTYVSLVGRDDDVPKLGRPGVAVLVEGVTQLEAIHVANELHRGLGRLVHTRPVASDEAGDYDLKVMLAPSHRDGRVSRVLFAASLTSADGELLWRIEGRAETEGASTEPETFASIGRNVISALVHDGWLQPRYDPDDPPPPPPQIRKDDSAR